MSFKIVFPIVFLFVFIKIDTMAQCQFSSGDVCGHSLKNGAHYVKIFKIDNENGDKDKIEYSYVMTKNTRYTITLCEKGSLQTNALDVTIYDAYRNKIAVLKPLRDEGLNFVCASTGIYYIEFRVSEEQKFCATTILGFKRNENGQSPGQ